METNNRDKQISRLVLRGFKSIAECDIELRPLNILIGTNGAGKSNFIGFFKLLNRLLKRELQLAVAEMGGADALLHFGRKKTEILSGKIDFYGERYFIDDYQYEFSLKPTQKNDLRLKEVIPLNNGLQLGNGGYETKLLCENGLNFDNWTEDDYAYYANPSDYEEYILHTYFVKERLNFFLYDMRTIMQSWRIYHFHDTSPDARVKQRNNINDNEYLREDARNLAAFLYRIKQTHPQHYRQIVKTIQLVAPFFGDFHLRPSVGNAGYIQLEWTEAGDDEPWTASRLSDGTLRFICLATALLQPPELAPATMLIDEPELGLHPFAISVLAELIHSASLSQQLIIATQSVELVNEFDAEDLIVVDRENQASVLRRLDSEALKDWLADYGLGELWLKNVLGGRQSS
ncbi:AAA family ATPase [Stenoxybacter acetivorans]|uniref:AAA family ATPase n=1 Tax=Stenoxybacter acetivorans TaxID=422441 RepID=UPI00055DB7C7|nr:AAA family ATPase [Stenoxybacter acetivorans]